MSRRGIVTAGRFRTAKRNAACVLCPRPIVKGRDRIGLIAGGWAHNLCIDSRSQIALSVPTGTRQEGSTA